VPDPQEGRATSVHLFLIILLGLLIFFPSLGLRDLWEPDEPRYAEVATEMRLLDDYLLLHLNGEIYAEKPPLFFWLSALFQGLGMGVAAGRVVSGTAALGTLLLTYAIGLLWFPSRTALLAAAILATTEYFGWISRIGIIDTTLVFFTTLSLYGFFRHRRNGGRWLILFYAGMGLAVLSKGPVGILVPALAATAATVISGGWTALRARHPLWGIPLLLAIVGLWLVPACMQGGEDFTRYVLFRQNLGRMVSSWSHQASWYYYLEHLPLNLLPWVVLTPWAFYWASRQKGWARGGAVRSFLCWFVLGLVFFSLNSGKRERYLLPLYPALALTLAAFLEHAFVEYRSGRGRAWLTGLLSLELGLLGVVGLCFVAFPAIAPTAVRLFENSQPDVAGALRNLGAWPEAAGILLAGAALLISLSIGWRSLARRRFARSVWCLIIGMVFVSLAYDLFMTPEFNRYRSPKTIALRINDLIPPGGDGEVAIYPENTSGAFNLYSGRPRIRVLHQPGDIDRFLAAPGRRLILSRKWFYREAENQITGPYRVTEAGRVGRYEFVFLSNFDPGHLARRAGATP
jgi:4-amino-4-deoxy-L-arabinose transferase-like glycosyltransferase